MRLKKVWVRRNNTGLIFVEAYLFFNKYILFVEHDKISVEFRELDGAIPVDANLYEITEEDPCIKIINRYMSCSDSIYSINYMFLVFEKMEKEFNIETQVCRNNSDEYYTSIYIKNKYNRDIYGDSKLESMIKAASRFLTFINV